MTDIKDSISNDWSGIELRHLVVLQQVARWGTFWAASESLDCSPSAISQQVAALEAIVGDRLVDRSRGKRGVTLTEAGALLLEHAEPMIARLHAAEADLAALRKGSLRAINVGTYQSISTRVLPSLLKAFARSYPGVRVRLSEGGSDRDLLALVERGELDLTFATLPLPAGPFDHFLVIEDPYVLAVPAAHPLSTRGQPISGEDLAGLDLMSIRSCQDHVEKQLHGLGQNARIGFVSDDNSVVQALVAAGMGAAIVPRLTMDEAASGIALIRLDQLPSRHLGVAWHRDRHRSPAVQGFIEIARATCVALDSASSLV